MWYPNKAAFRAGRVDSTQWDAANIGNYSFAVGQKNTASGQWSAALGQNNTASGENSLVAGKNSSATANQSIALGDNVFASGISSVAIGFSTTANSPFSIVLGSSASSNAKTGVFVFGDSSNPLNVLAEANDQFIARAAGGVKFFTNSAMTTGVNLPANGGAWSNLSDARMKANFRDLDGEDVLAKLARIPIREWNYISQDASIRHVGPTAQDFHAAFGLGEDERRISTLDPDGISLKAIQALDARTQGAQHEIARLKDENAALRAELGELRALVGLALRAR